MKKIFVCLVIVLCSKFSYARIDLDGVYYDNEGRRLEIYGGEFIFVDENGSWYAENYAKANYIWINGHIIALRHDVPDSVVTANMTVVEIIDSSLNLSTKTVSLHLPDIKKRELCISMAAGIDGEVYRYIYNGEHDDWVTINMPLNVEKIFLSIYPLNKLPVTVDLQSGYYNSYYSFCSVINLKNSYNKVEIEIPNLDDGYFGRYYVNGDYVRVVGDRLYWRGRVFEKSYDPEDIRYIEEKESALKK